jgi:glycosyltransferase involved in cell wall biosynthesis
MNPRGGTELMYEGLVKHASSFWKPNINLIISNKNVVPGKINILWQHLSYDQDNARVMADKEFVSQIDKFVYVSHWQYEKFRYFYNAPEHNAVVIRNCIEPMTFVEKPKGKIKLIYTSTPFRGLDVLIDAFVMLNRDDVELDVYSSTKIYGSSYDAATSTQYTMLFDRLKSTKNVNYMGYASNAGVRAAVQRAHIFAYPSTFEETSCISAIEAAAAGCKLLVTNYGALPETLGSWATYVPYNSDRDQLATKYATALSNMIDSSVDTKSQIEYFDKFWTWPYRILDWKAVLDEY